MKAMAASVVTSKRRIFRGWWMVSVAIVGQSFSVAAVLVYTFGIFAKPLAASFHVGRGTVALAVSMLDLAVTSSAPGIGRIVDRFGARRVIVISMLLMVGCLLGLSTVRPPVWHLYVLYAAAGCFGVATAPVTYSRVIASWFDRRRGTALGVASVGMGMGAFLGPSLAQLLVDNFGWRAAYAGLAAFPLLIALPVVAMFLVSTPQEVGLLPDGEPSLAHSEPLANLERPPEGMTLQQAVRTPTFWLLCSIFFIVSACCNGTAAHVAPLLTDAGASTRSAAFAASIYGLASMFGRVGNGYLVDRFFGPRVVACMFGAATIGITMLWAGCVGHAAYLAMFLAGLAMGAESDVIPFLISRYFGIRSMGELYGCAFASYTLGVATGRYVIGLGFDRTGSYHLPLACAALALLVATLATFLLRRYDSVRQEFEFAAA